VFSVDVICGKCGWVGCLAAPEPASLESCCPRCGGSLMEIAGDWFAADGGVVEAEQLLEAHAGYDG
jgi:ribosomal protein S27AE